MVKFFFRSKFLNAFYVLMLTAGTVHSQNTISGTVLSAEDSTAITGASIYFDGTSIGVSSGQDGDFKISYQDNNSALIITSLGYETLAFDPSEIKKLGSNSAFYLPIKREELETVYLETDPWSRMRKLQHFKKEFLGRNYAMYDCKIVNEDVIKLRYSPSKKTMIATANEPIIIHNNYLGYAIRYQLADFELGF
ncbi:carboxypeptidase-like regulatory domain-containing protein [Christiangramia portivictoriae]|uniref:carboxypeptidase-like regulatory domain-containing protein n=1 Tax=Christiangramia portivictoriae TaxID=326069 RepID=UPI00047E02EE|nr:carboxypeptidase-like regulatory domain-containing protein [Christiangramia portivictoriae]